MAVRGGGGGNRQGAALGGLTLLLVRESPAQMAPAAGEGEGHRRVYVQPDAGPTASIMAITTAPGAITAAVRLIGPPPT